MRKKLFQQHNTVKPHIICLFYIGLILAAGCSKPDIPTKEDPDKPNGTPDEQIITYQGLWQVPANDKIGPMAVNHSSEVLKIFHVNGQEYHFTNIFTGYQHRTTICKFDGDTWSECIDYPTLPYVSASDRAITAAILVPTNNPQHATLQTRVLTPGQTSWGTHEQTFSYTIRVLDIAATENDIYLLTKKTIEGTATLWKWSSVNQLWELAIESIPDSEDWNNIEAKRGLPGEFIVKEKADGLRFYVFKGNAFEQVYQGEEGLFQQTSANMVTIKGQYVLTLDKVYKLETSNTLNNYFTPREREILGSNAHGDKLFLIMGSTSWTGQTYVSHILIIDFTTGKVHQPPTDTDHISYFGLIDLSGIHPVKGWYFRADRENRIHGIVNTTVAGYPRPQAFRIVFPTPLQ